MIQVTVNDALKTLLGPLKEEAEIRDDHGGLLGYFRPAKTAEDRLRAKVAAEYDPREIARRKSSGETGRTTAEILERLGSQVRT